MSQSNAIEMEEKFRLCYSADVYFGTRPEMQLSPDGRRGIRKVQSDPNPRFQLSIEPEVSLSTRNCKGDSKVDGNGDQDGGVLEAMIHFAFVLTDTAPDDIEMARTHGTQIQMGQIVHCHSENGFKDAMANLDPESFDHVYRTAAGLMLEGYLEPISDIDAKVHIATARIQQRLYDLVMEARKDDPEFLGLGDEEMKDELRDSLLDFTPLVYMESVWETLAQLRALCINYERSKTPAPGSVSVSVSLQ
ncbi:hypothetical protein PG984_007079 [Apiospora sp. TS-2023a]